MTKAEQVRPVSWRLKVLQDAAEGEPPVARPAATSASRKAFYEWRKRYAALGAAGVGDRRRCPPARPTPRPRSGQQDSLPAPELPPGPSRIAGYLLRFHQQKIAVSTVHRLLRRHGLNRLRPIGSTGRTASVGSAMRSGCWGFQATPSSRGPSQTAWWTLIHQGGLTRGVSSSARRTAGIAIRTPIRQ
jgi:hypothetical protein